MINWHKGTWEAGDTVSYHKGKGPKEALAVFPGLYWYAGFGTGDLFLSEGKIAQNVSPSEASKLAQGAGILFQYVDSFITSSFISVQD